MQGWSPDFVSGLTEKAVAEGLIDEIVPVAGKEALRLTRALALLEGIFAGPSSGATLAAALSVAQRSPPGSHIVCMLPDTGERYLSTPLFEHIGVDMNDAEVAISSSTPGYRFDAPPIRTSPPAAVLSPQPAPQLNETAEAFFTQVVRDKPVVMFALEWCEFCWAVRKLFAKLDIACESVDLDSVAFQQSDMGLKLRAVLKVRTGSPTIPQIYIGGQQVGGCTDLFDAMRSGAMHRMLDAAGVTFNRDAVIDPFELLPKWVHPRKVA